MKILHICTGYNLDYNGGITNYVRSLAEEQAKEHDVYVLSDGGESKNYKVINFISRVPAWSYNKKSDKQSLSWLKQFIEDKNFDLIHIHMMLNIDQDIYKLLKGKTYVISLHDYYFICPRISMMQPTMVKRCEIANCEKCNKCFSILEKSWFLNRASNKVFGKLFTYKFPIKSKKVYKRWIEKNKQLLENARMLFPVSNRVKEIYENSGIKNEYHVLHIGNITSENFDNVHVKQNTEFINLVLLSSVNKQKGGPLFFDILKKVNNPILKVHFYGRTNEKEKIILKELNIEDHGEYKQADLPNILSQMDMGVMTPIWEDNGPQVVMEMINNHLPVFATKMGGITDFVNDKNGFLFDPYDIKDIEKAVVFLNTLDYKKVISMRNNLKRTLSPSEHFVELSKYYNILCGSDHKN